MQRKSEDRRFEGALKAFPLGFRDVVVTMGAAHYIAASSLSALQSRIKDFQRRGFPEGLNTGKGRAASYEAKHVLQLAFAFELLELGMTPDRICLLFLSARAALINELRCACRHAKDVAAPKQRTIAYLDPQALSGLRDELRHPSDRPTIQFGTVSDVDRMLRRGIHRLALIDLGSLVKGVVVCVSAATDVPNGAVAEELLAWSSSNDIDPQA
jgi:hypothetical protein